MGTIPIYIPIRRQDDTGLTGIPVPRNIIIPTFSHGDWLECKQHKKVSISNIVRIQKYETQNMLKPTKHRSENNDMLEIVDEPVQTHTKENNATKNQPCKSCVKMFAGNCSSFSEKVKEYIISKHKTFDMWSLVETHDTRDQSNFWKNIGFKTNNNKALPTSDLGSHGGEIVACKTYMNTTLIKQEVWDVIKEVPPTHIRVAAMLVKINKIQFINATTYLNVGEEFSTTNVAIIQQLVMLQNLLNLPIFAFGDYNIDILDMKQSGFLKAHGLHVLELPGGPSVKFGKRKIDYVLYSGGLHQMIKNMFRIYKIPYGPHFGYKITFNGNSNITGTLQ